jgi:hypothetical protein
MVERFAYHTRSASPIRKRTSPKFVAFSSRGMNATRWVFMGVQRVRTQHKRLTPNVRKRFGIRPEDEIPKKDGAG